MSHALPRAWSLGHELSTIERAVEGAGSLLAQVHDTPGDERAMRARASEAEAMLALVHRRLHDLGRVLRGELDPWLLAAPHNLAEAGDTPTNPGEDVVFSTRPDVPATRSARRPHR